MKTLGRPTQANDAISQRLTSLEKTAEGLREDLARKSTHYMYSASERKLYRSALASTNTLLDTIETIRSLVRRNP